MYSHILRDLTKSENQSRTRQITILKSKTEEIESRLFNVDELYIECEIDKDSYQRMKVRYQEDLSSQRMRLKELEMADSSFGEQLQFIFGLLSNLGQIWKNADVELKK